MQHLTSLKTDSQEVNADEFVHLWKHFLQEQDHSPGTVKKYTQALVHFLTWYEQKEHEPLCLAQLTPNSQHVSSDLIAMPMPTDGRDYESLVIGQI